MRKIDRLLMERGKSTRVTEMCRNDALDRQAVILTFRPLIRSIIYHRKAPNVLFHVYLNHFSYISKLTGLLAID